MKSTGKYIGSSKFDKLRRVSVIKPVAEILKLKDGDEVSFYQLDDEIIIRKRVTQDEDKNELIDEYIEKLKKVAIIERDGNTVTMKIPDGIEQPFDYDELTPDQQGRFMNELSKIMEENPDYQDYIVEKREKRLMENNEE